MPYPSRARESPWPLQTPSQPVPSPSSPRKRPRRQLADHVDRRTKIRRETIADEQQVEDAKNRCELLSGNNIISCFPTADVSIPQHQFASFVWNSRLPYFTQTNLVNIYLYSATTQNILLQWHNVTNPTGRAGVLRAAVNDSWWGDRGDMWNGSDVPFLFYWLITRAEEEAPSGTDIPQAIFTAVQTTFADSIVASMASTSAAAESSREAASRSSAIAASLSSASAATASPSGTGTRPGSGPADPTATGGDGSGNVQSASSSSFPHWAIAVIVVLGFLALVFCGILAFLVMRRLRRQRSTLSHRGSMGSATPMMANAQQGEPTSPVTASAYGAPAAYGAAYGATSQRATSPEAHDGASTISGSDAALFSGADAAVMADAFRAALRKPNFADRPVEEGESPDTDPDNGGNAGAHPTHGLLDRELAEEGRDIRSVGSSRGVRVETLSDAADDTDTIQDRP